VNAASAEASWRKTLIPTFPLAVPDALHRQASLILNLETLHKNWPMPKNHSDVYPQLIDKRIQLRRNQVRHRHHTTRAALTISAPSDA
jgi:hypothetical protein